MTLFNTNNSFYAAMLMTLFNTNDSFYAIKKIPVLKKNHQTNKTRQLRIHCPAITKHLEEITQSDEMRRIIK